MSIEEALNELKKHAEAFTNVGDAKEAIVKDKEGFLKLWTLVLQYFNYIKRSKEVTIDQLVDANAIVLEISENNPSLTEWVNDIIDVKKELNTTKEITSDETEDLDKVFNDIANCFEELDNMKEWDTNKLMLIKESLEHYKNAIQKGMNDKNEEETQMFLDAIDYETQNIDRITKEIEGIASKMDF